jgi:hypothetical protein
VGTAGEEYMIQSPVTLLFASVAGGSCSLRWVKQEATLDIVCQVRPFVVTHFTTVSAWHLLVLEMRVSKWQVHETYDVKIV